MDGRIAAEGQREKGRLVRRPPVDAKEAVSHSTGLVPYNCFKCYMPELPIVLLHWHEEMEIDFLREGTAIYQVDQEVFQAYAGDIVLAAPNTLHAVTPVPAHCMVSDTLIFNFSLLGYASMDQCTLSNLQPVLNGSMQIAGCIRPADAAYTEIAACLNQLFSCIFEKKAYFELEMKEILYRFIHLLYQKRCIFPSPSSKRSNDYTEKMKKSLQFIQDHFKEAITVGQAAEVCHFSKAYFMQFFKEAIGISCMDYIILMRLRCAVVLLADTDEAISEIALECGFHNLSNFNRQFKDCYKMTPREYRKQNQRREG